MLQPFYPFKAAYVDKFIALKKKYFVAQSYPRGQKEAEAFEKTAMLLSDYDNPGLAKNHLAAIKQDSFAAIIDTSKEKHLTRLREILNAKSPYLVYWNAVKSNNKLKAHVKKKYRDHIKRYIDKNTRWHIGREETIEIEVELEFGTLFMVINRGKQSLRIPLAEIEKA